MRIKPLYKLREEYDKLLESEDFNAKVRKYTEYHKSLDLENREAETHELFKGLRLGFELEYEIEKVKPSIYKLYAVAGNPKSKRILYKNVVKYELKHKKQVIKMLKAYEKNRLKDTKRSKKKYEKTGNKCKRVMEKLKKADELLREYQLEKFNKSFSLDSIPWIKQAKEYMEKHLKKDSSQGDI
jgi:hypothetical protein